MTVAPLYKYFFCKINLKKINSFYTFTAKIGHRVMTVAPLYKNYAGVEPTGVKVSATL